MPSAGALEAGVLTVESIANNTALAGSQKCGIIAERYLWPTRHALSRPGGSIRPHVRGPAAAD